MDNGGSVTYIRSRLDYGESNSGLRHLLYEPITSTQKEECISQTCGYRGSEKKKSLRRPFYLQQKYKLEGLNFMKLQRKEKSLSLKSGMCISNDLLSRSLGVCQLRNQCLVVSESLDKPYAVKIFTPGGVFVKTIEPLVPFIRPSSVISLENDDKFAVLDDTSVNVFDMEGSREWSLELPRHGRHYGLVEDNYGNIVTIEESDLETNLIYINQVTHEIFKSIKVISYQLQQQDYLLSKCRFLTFKSNKFFITDLGLNKVYVLSECGQFDVCGMSGIYDHCFNDPAAVVVDDFGNLIIADSRSHKLVLYSSDLQYVCKLELDPPTNRPTGISLSRDKRSLLVLNLKGSSRLVKYDLGHES